MRIAGILTALLLAGSAWAEAPEELKPEGSIFVAIGQIKVFRFSETVSQVNVLTPGQIEATAQTDRQITIVGIKPGVTQIVVFGADKTRLFDAEVTVTPDPGRLVKLWLGTGKDDTNAGHVAVYCTEFGCGRPDQDFARSEIPVQRISRSPRDKQ